jgi:hypothetical protein
VECVLEQHSTAAAIARSKKRQQRSKKQKAVEHSSSSVTTTTLAVTLATTGATALITDMQINDTVNASAATPGVGTTTAGAGTTTIAATATATATGTTAGGAERVALCWVAVHTALALTVSKTVELLKGNTPEGESPTTHSAKRIRNSSTRNSAAVKNTHEKYVDAMQTLAPDVISAEQVSTNKLSAAVALRVLTKALHVSSSISATCSRLSVM